MLATTKRTRPAAMALLLALAASGCASAGGRTPAAESEAEAARHAPMNPLTLEPAEFLAAAEGSYVVVDLDVNQLHFMDSGDTLWSAPVGTGTGLRLQGPDGEWSFATPRGVFQIQFKEEMPVWYLPDWYFVEKKLPIPPENSPERRLKNQLGIAAVYLGQEIAIHGTERPELLGQRVSHGCIRLANEYALRLFHNVQVGTPVVVIGGEQYDTLPPPPSTDPGGKPARRTDPLAGVSTAELLRRLDRALQKETLPADAVWIASRLLTRGVKDDAEALRGLLERAGTGANDRVNREYATYLADGFYRASLRAVVSLARIDEAARERAARHIVRAMVSLHPGEESQSPVPWPTRRVPPTELGPAGRAGWEALAAAEEEYRTGRTASRGNRASL